MARTRQPDYPHTADLSVGRMIITCEDHDGILVPTVEFDPVGKISQGWFDRHSHVFQRAIQRAQVIQRQVEGRRGEAE